MTSVCETHAAAIDIYLCCLRVTFFRLCSWAPSSSDNSGILHIDFLQLTTRTSPFALLTLNSAGHCTNPLDNIVGNLVARATTTPVSTCSITRR